MYELYEEDVVYRPPFEVESLLLEVTLGCTYGKCAFCRDATGERKFHRIPIEVVKQNARILGMVEWNKTSAFLLGENAFALKADYIKEIFEIMHEFTPNIRKISMFSRADDVKRKSMKELVELKEMGLGDLYIGVESGSDAILKRINKGETVQDLLEALNILDEVQIPYSLSSILGLGGKEHWHQHAIETAAFFNKVNPKTIRLMTLTPVEGTPLYEDIKSGHFVERTRGEILLEEKLFLENLEVKNCFLLGTHVSNNVPIAGFFPKHKKQILQILDSVIAGVDLKDLTHTTYEQW